jgi:hypothetical protein
MFEIERMASSIDCRTNCEYAASSSQAACLSRCPKANPEWEKNGVGVVDRLDLELAILEHWDNGTLTKICYSADGWVRPAGMCNPQDCLTTRSPADCEDKDGDGLKAWQEKLFGTQDTEPNAPCAQNAQCGFTATCFYHQGLAEGRCVPRSECSGHNTSKCTAYHLELVEQNNSQVVVRVHYDYSPVQARVLDLYIDYKKDALSLLDARLMQPVIAAGKELQTNHTSEGYLRLIVLGTGSTAVIPFGPVVELVFSRISDQQTNIDFLRNKTAQRMSQAPSNDLVQQELENNALWDGNVTIDAHKSTGPRLLLYYPFDELREPLGYADVKVKDSVELCGRYSPCSVLDEEDDTQRADKVKILAQLETLQRGWSKVSQSVPGVRDRAGYFDGREDHLELPIIAEDSRSYTLETWFYAEAEIADTGVSQILFNQQTSGEVTSYGVGLGRSAVPGAVDLLWFVGNAEASSGLVTQTIARGLSVLDWHYLTMTVTEGSQGQGTVLFYLNGAALPTRATLTDLELKSCPAPASVGKGLDLHKEGEGFLAGGAAPQTVFYASTQNNLYGIERMDPSGFARQEVIRNGTFQAMDPDYSPETGKLVYVSTETGNFEIWIANEDGSQARPITRGFGDTARGIFARRPRWAPDASGIVFESNVFSVEHNHNCYAKAYQLYYIAYDNKKNEVAIADPGGGTMPLSELDYGFFQGNQTLFKVTLTDDSARNHTGVVWLRLGRAGQDLGRIAFTQADKNFDKKVIRQGTIRSPEDLSLDSPPVAGSGQGAELLDFHVDTKTGIETYLVARTEVGYRPTSQFKVQSVAARGTTGYDVRIFFTPQGYSPNVCWDVEKDGKCNTLIEDLDGNNKCDVFDCYPSEVGALFVAYDSNKVSFDSTLSIQGQEVLSLGKNMEFEDSSTAYGEFVRILIGSAFNSTPLKPGHVATLHFKRKGSDATTSSDYSVRSRSETRDLALGGWGALAPVTIPQLTEVSEARFSPDGERLLVAGLENARPVLVQYQIAPKQVLKVSTVPQRVEGLDWNVTERFYPCQWVGATRNPNSKLLRRSFRGGLDEMRLYSYVRTADAIRSEFERSRRWLDKAGESAKPKAQFSTCDKHTDCPEYQLCGGNGTTDPKGVCKTVDCETKPCPQGGGECTLLPVPLGGGESLQFVCSAECDSDRECFEQDCRNGQCRFCDTGTGGTNTCLECRLEPVEIPGLKPFMEIKGCPDRNSFLCEDGSCYSECYAIQNGQSRYLCAPGVEYCKQGRCVSIQWTWDDFAPSTMSGLAQMTMDGPNAYATTALSQLYPVTIEAYGVEDYLESPQVIVEGRVLQDSSGLPKYYGTNWFEVGVVTVHNKSKTEAENNLYTVLSPYPMEQVRLRLISPPFENGNQGNHGLMEGEKEFCGDWDTKRSNCWHRATGSRANIGYPVGIPRAEARRACYKNGRDNAVCQYQEDSLRPYLWGGQPAVVVLGMSVNGKDVMIGLEENLACGYASKSGESTTKATRIVPGKPHVEIKRQVFGSLADEVSGQKAGGALIGMDGPNTLVKGQEMVGSSMVLLNCTMAKPKEGKVEEMVAGATFTVCEPGLCVGEYGIYKQRGVVGAISETPNSCDIVNGLRTQPCYEWMGNEANIDIMSKERFQFGTLDYDTFRSSGVAEGEK